MYIKQERMI